MTIDNIPEAFGVTLRIKILSSLIASSRTFNEMIDITGATKGNLSTQMSKLESWGYLNSVKVIENRKTKTTYTITPFGLRQFEEYVDFLRSSLRKEK